MNDELTAFRGDGGKCILTKRTVLLLDYDRHMSYGSGGGAAIGVGHDVGQSDLCVTVLYVIYDILG